MVKTIAWPCLDNKFVMLIFLVLYQMKTATWPRPLCQTWTRTPCWVVLWMKRKDGWMLWRRESSTTMESWRRRLTSLCSQPDRWGRGTEAGNVCTSVSCWSKRCLPLSVFCCLCSESPATQAAEPTSPGTPHGLQGERDDCRDDAEAWGTSPKETPAGR